MLIAVYICVYFCHSLLFIWFYFLLVLLLLFSLSFSFSLFFRLCLHCTVRTAFTVCVFVVFLYFMMCFWNKTDLTKICSPSHFSLSLSLWILFVDLPFYACEWVYIGVCVYVSERDAQHRRWFVFQNISNYLTLTKQWNVIYSTRKLQRDLIKRQRVDKRGSG